MMTQSQFKKWKRNPTPLSHFPLIGLSGVHEAATPVLVLSEKQTILQLIKSFLTRAQPKMPAIMRIDREGVTFMRGNSPQEESVLRGYPFITFSWDQVAGIRYNKWLDAAVELGLKAEHKNVSKVYVVWFNGYRYDGHGKPHTEEMYKLLSARWQGMFGDYI